jgi:hypothetical protein
MADKNTKKSRSDKLTEIGLNESYTTNDINDNILDRIYGDIMKKKENIELTKGQYVSKPKNDKVLLDDPRYKLTIEILNAILLALNKKKINSVTEFININKDDLSKNECKHVICAYHQKIVDLFEKYGVNEFYRLKGNNYVINYIRSIVVNCGYSFVGKTHENKEKYDNGMYKRVYRRLYSII